jgi:tRNA (guanine37-N1)-methyltransferase
MSPRGKPLTQARVQTLVDGPGAVILCGRFEGVDQRVIDHFQIEEVSIGDYVLSGGELAAQVMLDAAVRLIPGVLGNQVSTEQESFSNGLLEHPQYTRPPVWEGHEIPEILMSGHHGNVAKWQKQQSEALTQDRRPDLWEAFGG